MVINDKLKGPFYRAPTQKLASRNNVLTTLNELVDYYNNLTKTLENMFDTITDNREIMKTGLMQMYEKTVRFKKILDNFNYDIDSHILERMNSSIDNFQNVITAFVEPYEANLFNHNTTTDNLVSNVSGDEAHAIEEWDRSVNIVPTSLGIRWYGGKISDKSFIDTVNKQLELVKVNSADGHVGEDIINSNLILEFFIYTPRGITWLVLGENGSLGYNLYVKYQTGGDSIMLDINSENMRIAKNYDLNKFDFEMVISALVGNDVVKNGNVYIKVKTNIPANHQSGRESYMLYAKNDGSVVPSGVNSQATQEKNVIDMSYGLLYHDNKDVAFVMGQNDTLETVVNKKYPKTVTPNLMNPISTRVVQNKVDLNKTTVGSRIFVTNGLFSQYSLDSNHSVLFGSVNGDYVNPFYSPDTPKYLIGKAFADIEPIFNLSLSEDPKYFNGELSIDMCDETYINNPSLIYKNEIMFAVDNLEMKEKVIPNIFGIDKSTLSSDIPMKITNDERFEMASKNSLYQDAIPLKESSETTYKVFKIYGIDKYIIFGTSDGIYYIDTSLSRSGDVIRKINNNGAFGKCYDIIGNNVNSIFLSTDKGIHILNMQTMNIVISGILNGEWSDMFKLNNGMFGAISRSFKTSIENGKILYKDSVGIMYSSTFNTIKNVFPNNEEYYTINDNEAVSELTNEDLMIDYMNKRAFQKEFTIIPDPARNRYFIFRYGHKMCVTQNTYMTETSTFDFTNIKIVNVLKNYKITSAVMRDNKIYLSTLLGQNYVYDLPSDTVSQVEWNKDVNINNRMAHQRIYYLKTLNHLKNDDATVDSTRISCYVTIANNEIFFIPLDPTNEVLGITYTNGYYYVLCNNDYVYKLDENWNIVNVIGSRYAKEIIAVENMLFIDSNSFGTFGGYINDGTQEFDNVCITNGGANFYGIDENTPFNPESINLHIAIENYKGIQTYVPSDIDVGLNGYHYAIFIDPNAAHNIAAIDNNDTVLRVGYMSLIDPDLRDDNQYFVHTGIVDLVKQYVLELTGGEVTEYPDIDDYTYTPLTPEQFAIGPVSGTTYYTQDIEITDKFEVVSSIDVTAPVPNMDYYKETDDGYVLCTDADYNVKDIYQKINVEEVTSPVEGVDYYNRTNDGEYVPMDESTLILEGTRYELVDQTENPYDENTQYWKKSLDNVYVVCTPADFDIGRDGETVFFENYEYYLMIPGTARYFNVNVDYYTKTGETYKEWKTGETYYTRVVIQENHNRYIDVGTPSSFDPDTVYFTRTSKSPITTEYDPSDESVHLLELNTRRVPKIFQIYGKNPVDVIDSLNTQDTYWAKYSIENGEDSDSIANNEVIPCHDDVEYNSVDKTTVTIPQQDIEYFTVVDEEYVSAGIGGDTLTAWEPDTEYFTKTVIDTDVFFPQESESIKKLTMGYGNVTVAKRSYDPVDIFTPVDPADKIAPADLSVFDNDETYKIRVTKNEIDYVPFVGTPVPGEIYYKKIPAGESEPQYIKINRDVEGTKFPNRVYADYPYSLLGSGLIDLPVADPNEDYYFKEYITGLTYRKITLDDVKEMTQNLTIIPRSLTENGAIYSKDGNEQYNPILLFEMSSHGNDSTPDLSLVGSNNDGFYIQDGDNYVLITQDDVDNWVEGTEYFYGSIYYSIDFDNTEYFVQENGVIISYRERTPTLYVDYDEFGVGDVYQLKSIDTYVIIPENEIQDFIDNGGILYSQRTSHVENLSPSEYKSDYDLYKDRTEKVFMHDIPESHLYEADPKFYFIGNDDYAKYSFRELERITFENYDEIPNYLGKVTKEVINNWRRLTPEEVSAGAIYGETYCVRTYNAMPNTCYHIIDNDDNSRYATVDTSVITTPDPDTTYYYYNSDKDNSGYVEIPAGSISTWDPNTEYYFIDKSNKSFDINALRTDEIYIAPHTGLNIRVIREIISKNDAFRLVTSQERLQGMQLGKMYFHKIEEEGVVRYEFATETSFDNDVSEYYTLIDITDFAIVDIRDDLDIYHYEIGPGDNPKYRFTPVTKLSDVIDDPYADHDFVFITCDRFKTATYWNKRLNQFNDPTRVPKYSDDPVELTPEEIAAGPKQGYEYFKEVTVEIPNDQGYVILGKNNEVVPNLSTHIRKNYVLVDKPEEHTPLHDGPNNYFRLIDGEYVMCDTNNDDFDKIYNQDHTDYEYYLKPDVDYYNENYEIDYLKLSDDGLSFEVPEFDDSEGTVNFKQYYHIDIDEILVPDPDTIYYHKERVDDVLQMVEIPVGSISAWEPDTTYFIRKIYDIYDKQQPLTTPSTELVRVDPSELENGFDEDTVYYAKELTNYGDNTFYLQQTDNEGRLEYQFDVKVEKFLRTDLDNFNIEDFNVYINPIYDGIYGMISSDLESKFNNNCLNKPRVKTLNVVHNNLERFGGNSKVRESLSDTIEWFRTGYVDPNGYEIFTNSTNTKIRLNNAVTDGNYMTVWYETGYYTPTSSKIYTNYNNTKFRYDNIDYKGSYKDDAVNGVGWFDTMYKVPGETSDAGKRILTNYNNSKLMIEGNGVTISEDYKSHWFRTGLSYTVISYYKGGYKNNWKVAANDTITLYTNYNNTKTRAPALSSSKWNGSDTVVDLPYNHSNIAYLNQIWVNDTLHSARTDCQGWAGWDNRNDRNGDNPITTVYNTLGNPPIVYMPESNPEEDGVVRRYKRISDGKTSNTGCNYIRFSGSPLIKSF